MVHSEKVVSEQLRNPNDTDYSPAKVEFGPFETVHRWKRMSECDEIVIGSRRSKHTAVAYDHGIYVFGGDNGKSMLNDLIKFDTIDKTWSKMSCVGTPPAPRYHHSAVVHNSSMFVFGGYTGDILANSNLTNKNDLFEFKFKKRQWLQRKFVGPEPVPRSAHGAAVYNDKLWIFAGYDGNARLNDMWTISLVGENRQWERIKQNGECPPTCCNFPVAVARGKMFVFSGQSGAKITNALFQFDFETHTWSRVCTEHILRCAGSAPARRYGHVMLAHNRHLYVFGGAADNTLPSDLYCYELDTQMWSVIPPAPDSSVPSGRLFHAGAIVDNAMYIFGGTVDNNVRSGDLFRFQLSDYPRCTLAEDFGRILKSQQFCDIMLVVGEEEVHLPAHQAILAARSHYLRAKIREAREDHERRKSPDDKMDDIYNPKKTMLTVKLPEATPEPFKMVLNYIYMDKIDPTEKDEPPSSANAMLLVMEVLRLALRLNIPRLFCLCTRFLKANLCYSNVLTALHAAHYSNLTPVKEFCLRFIVKDYNFTTIVMSEEFEALEQGLMVEVIRKRQQPAPKQPIPEPEDDMQCILQGTTLEHDMASFLRNSTGKELSDVVLRIDGITERTAHKSILAARASFFEAMFRSFTPQDNAAYMRICDAVPTEAAMDALLQYIYYGDTTFTYGSKMLPMDDSVFLFQAPIYYGFTNNRLQVFGKHHFQTNATPKTALAVLEAAERINAPDIKEYALKMIVHHFSAVARQEQIKNLPQTLLVSIIQALADEPRYDTPNSIPSSSSADTLTDDDSKPSRNGKT